jgi:hypothetical protein
MPVLLSLLQPISPRSRFRVLSSSNQSGGVVELSVPSAE